MTRSQHGTNSRYTMGCKCVPCKRAHADYQRYHRQKLRPPKVHDSLVLAFYEAANGDPELALGWAADLIVEGVLVADKTGLRVAA